MTKRKLNIILWVLVVIFGGFYQSVYSDVVPELDSNSINYLREGNIIITKYKQKTKDGEVARVTGIICIHKPVEEVWKCVLDWESMHKYVNGLDYYKIVQKINADTSIIEGQIHVAFLKFRYTLIVNNNKNRYYQQWRLVNENDMVQYRLQDTVQQHSSGIKNIQGFQYCIPLDASCTILYYAPVVEVSVPVPGFVENSLTQKSIKDYLYGIKRYLESK